MSQESSQDNLNNLLESWANDSSRPNLILVLTKLVDLFEKELEIYFKMDPDPFDDRHPSRLKPSCNLGSLLKILFKNDDFMSKLVNEYLMNRDDKELQILSCRLALDILPGLETSVVFNEAIGLLDRIFEWARNDDEPLQSYAAGLLGAAMALPDIVAHSKEKNTELVPIMIKKLKFLMEERRKLNQGVENYSNIENLESATKRRRISSPSNDCSNSSWAEMETFVIGTTKIYPLTNEISQRFIFQYLESQGEYQEFLSFIFEHNVLDMILETIDLNRNSDVRLAFNAMKYLASLVCHKKFALEFVNRGGIQALLKVYKQSLGANGVSLCLSSIAYHDDVMEKICMLPKNILSELVSYCLWLIERSHDTSRSNCMIFFSLTFSYRSILELFDSQDGLRKILNEILMIDIIKTDHNTPDDDLFIKRQYAKYIGVALKRYFENHLIIKAQSLIRANVAMNNNETGSSNFARLLQINTPPYKPINYNYDLLMEHVEAMLHMVPARSSWEPAEKLIKYGGAKLLLQYLSVSYDWNFAGKADAIRSALDVLVVCTVLPKFQQILTETIREGETSHSVLGMNILLAAAAGELVNDPDCQRSALNAIINCVCGPINRASVPAPRLNSSASKKRVIRVGEDTLNKLWNCVRYNNGIMTLINLLMVKTPITDADSIRALSCKALCGLARSENVRQVICKLPLFTNGLLQTLMKEPILQDKRTEHLKFCKHCIELIERVTGNPVTDNLETSLGTLNKAEVVTQTKIVFNEKELLKLIYNHLIQKGLTKTANTLAEEADLSEFNNQTLKNFTTPVKNVTPRMSRQISLSSFPSSQNSSKTSIPNSDNSNVLVTTTSTGIPIKINRSHKNSKTNNVCLNSRRLSMPYNTPIIKRKLDGTSSQPIAPISLDSIVIEYLRKQHALCKNPVIACPPFDLFKPHRCPEPRNRDIAPHNITARLIRRQYDPPYGGHCGAKMDRKFIYSRFRLWRSLRCFDPTLFLACAFSYNTNMIYVSGDNGELNVFNYQTGELENTFSCNDSCVIHVEPSWDEKSILTASWDANPVLWSIGDDYALDEKMTFESDSHVEFGKASQDKVLGTQESTAHLYDLNTSQMLRTFKDEFSNQYVNNIATFHPSDHLILNDGVLWDVRAETPLHKFDKLNDHINGIFHPNGQEIISSSEIWDVKTYKLLKTVPALAQGDIKFNKKGDVIYALYEDEEKECTSDDNGLVNWSSSFRTFDGYDYSSIATIDVKRPINAIAVDPNDKYIALIESTRDSNLYFSRENVVRLYEVGRCRDEDDEERVIDDDDEEEEEDESDNLSLNSNEENSYSDDNFEEDYEEIMSEESELSDPPSNFSGSDDNSYNSDDDNVYYQLNPNDD